MNQGTSADADDDADCESDEDLSENNTKSATELPDVATDATKLHAQRISSTNAKPL